MTKQIALFALALSLPLAACGDADDPAVVTDDTITIETPDVDGAMDDMGDAADDAADATMDAADDAADATMDAADEAGDAVEAAGEEAEEEIEEGTE